MHRGYFAAPGASMGQESARHYSCMCKGDVCHMCRHAQVYRWSLLELCSASGCTRRTCRAFRPPWNVPDLSRSWWYELDKFLFYTVFVISRWDPRYPVLNRLVKHTLYGFLSDVTAQFLLWALCSIVTLFF